MIGYKLLNKDMKAIHGNGMQYELNKKYFMNKEDVSLNKSGYHFYKSLEDCINSNIYAYNISNSRFFKVEVGEYIEDGCGFIDKLVKSVSNEILLLEEISREDIIEYCKENRYKINKMALVKLGLFLDELSLNDEELEVRFDVARQGKYLDVLYKDEIWTVRLEVAKHGKYLDILVNDKDEDVREEVAKQGKYLDILVNDKSWFVRSAIAKQGKYLAILVHDETWMVRAEVAKQGKYLDILVNDKDEDVREEVAKQGKDKYLDILVNDENPYVRSAIARQGKFLDILIHDEDSNVREEIARQGKYLDILVKDKEQHIRLIAHNQLRIINYLRNNNIYNKTNPYNFMGEHIIHMSTRDKVIADKVVYTTIQITFEDGSILAGRINRVGKDTNNIHISSKTTYTGKKYFFIINGVNLINIANSHTWK